MTMNDTDGAREWVDVLLVEDSPGDVRLTQEAFRTSTRPSGCTLPPTAWRQWHS